MDKRLLAAPVEAKAFLENSKSLAFINELSEPAIPEVFPARLARTPGDFLRELQETIFQSQSGECLDRELLERLYDSNRQASNCAEASGAYRELPNPPRQGKRVR